MTESNIITIEDIKNAINTLNKDSYCKKCKTNEDYIVAGYYGRYCKCEADKLSRTKLAKNAQREIKHIMFGIM